LQIRWGGNLKKTYPVLEIQEIEHLPDITLKTSDESLAQDRIRFRRKRVNQLRLRGNTNEEIARITGYSLSTIEKDLHEINELSRNWFEEESIKEFCESIQDSIILCDNAKEELQILYTEYDDLDSKLKILTKITEFEEKKNQLYSETKAVKDYRLKGCRI